MSDLKTLAEFGASGIAIAIIIAFLLIVKWLLPIAEKLRENLEKNTEATIKNTETTVEMAQWLKNRNGILEKKLDKLNKKK